MLGEELKKYQKYINKQHSNNEMLKEIIKLKFVTRGELFDILLGINTKLFKIKRNLIIFLSIAILSLLLNLVCMILLMLL